jgi:hypothetical protein
MIPSQIGIVQIRNIAPESIEQQCMPEGLVFYGFGNQQSLHRTGGLPRSQLCEIAKRSGFDRLYLIESVSDPKLNSVVNCSNIPAG